MTNERFNYRARNTQITNDIVSKNDEHYNQIQDL